jgi:hypothetical protein
MSSPQMMRMLGFFCLSAACVESAETSSTSMAKNIRAGNKVIFIKVGEKVFSSLKNPI